jgi:hypothetical protein
MKQVFQLENNKNFLIRISDWEKQKPVWVYKYGLISDSRAQFLFEFWWKKIEVLRIKN